MSRWIDADALKEKIDNIWNGRPLSSLGARILAMIDSAPSIDIVRCKECVNNDINCRGTENWCLHFGYDVEDDDFCSYGERKE